MIHDFQFLSIREMDNTRIDKYMSIISKLIENLFLHYITFCKNFIIQLKLSSFIFVNEFVLKTAFNYSFQTTKCQMKKHLG